MKRSRGVLKKIQICTVPAAMLVLCLAVTACQKKMPGRLDGLYSSDGAVTSQTQAADTPSDDTGTTSATAQNKIIPAPKFRTGSYTMESASVSEQYFYSGQSVISYTRVTQTYHYDIALAVKKDGFMTAVYTFQRIRTGYETEEGATVTDTHQKSGRNEDNAVYYDLIGQSFTVSISKDYRITVKGIDAIHKKFPYTADVVTDENMKEVAADLFYKLKDSIQQGSSWKLRQVGLQNTYTVSSVKDGSLYVNIKGEKLDLPEPFTSDGVTYTYKKREPLSGSLVMAMDNRMIQEQSSYQENAGVIQSGDKKYTFTESAASVCNIKKK
ncbi:MAG: hypothetical protein IJM51_03445 [Clostridia bacterium]|nr:hypothetical protein [Clostridia bacterium]